MCIIIAKPSGVNVPLTETLDNCFNANKDGIGFAYNLPGEDITIHKGFMNVKKLEHMLSTHQITKDHNLIIHFRFATHGKKDQGNCHPFPLTEKFDTMRILHCTCPVAIAHNGVFGGMPVSEMYSDTMKFIGGVLSSPEVINNLESKSVKELIKGYCGFGSKLAFLRPQGLSLVGNFELDEGVYYSNGQYKSFVTRRNDKWEPDALGKTWCYHHDTRDFCKWCHEHNKWDECDYNKKKALDAVSDCCKTPILIGKNHFKECLWCTIESDNVKYNHDAQGNLCNDCSVTINNYGTNGRYYD